MDDKHTFHCDWLSDVLKSELLISEKELLADLGKTEHSFLRNLLTNTAVNDEYELEYIQKSESDVFDNTAVSADLTNNPSDCADLTEQSEAQVAHTESEKVVKPPGYVGKGSKCGRLRCQISRKNSAGDRSFADDVTDNLLKTPAGFYDRSCSPSCLSIPPLFDYSSSPFSNPCHMNNASCAFSSADISTLCSIMEDEKWSEGSEISSVDIDASSASTLSPTDFPDEGTLSMSEDEEELSKQEERVVLSVLQNVLADEAALLSLDSAKDESCSDEPQSSPAKDESCSDEPQSSPEISSSESSVVVESSPVHSSSTTDVSRLNPLAQPFNCVVKVPLQPMPVVIAPSMPTVVVPIKLAYTTLVPFASSKSSASKRPEKTNAQRHNTPKLSSSAPNSK